MRGVTQIRLLCSRCLKKYVWNSRNTEYDTQYLHLALHPSLLTTAPPFLKYTQTPPGKHVSSSTSLPVFVPLSSFAWRVKNCNCSSNPAFHRRLCHHCCIVVVYPLLPASHFTSNATASSSLLEMLSFLRTLMCSNFIIFCQSSIYSFICFFAFINFVDEIFTANHSVLSHLFLYSLSHVKHVMILFMAGFARGAVPPGLDFSPLWFVKKLQL